MLNATARRESRRLPLFCCLLALTIPSDGARLLAQTPLAPSFPNHSGRAPGALAQNSVFNKTNAILGWVFLGSLLLIEPLEGFDERATRELSDPGSEGQSAPRASGRALGTMPASLAITVGTHLIGRLTGSSALQRAGLHSLEALVAADLATQVFKLGVGRARPSISSDSDKFDSFKFDSDYHSFPSGHASHVFAVAATISRDLKDDAPWVPFVAYPLATWTATTRVLDRKHWVTDVIGGAALGMLTSRFVERLNHRADGSLSWTLFPGSDGGVGIGLDLRFK